MARRRRNPWTSTGEVLIWILFALLLFPAAFAGYAVGHYTSLGKPPKTVTVGTTAVPATTTSAATTTTSSSGGDVAAGKALFTANGCSSCHTFAAAGSTGTIGPNLGIAPAMDAQADGNMALAAFIKQSIIDPSAYIAKGFKPPSVMPATFGTSLKPTQIDDLVAFILSGTSK